jgi:D-alanine transaminase
MYIHITRGGSLPRSHAYNKEDTPVIYCDIKPMQLPHYPKFEKFKVITHPDQRWSQCHIKSTNLIANTMAYNQAVNQGAVEAILHRDQQVVEGSKSNVFMVKNNTVITPPLRPYMLGGTMRYRTLELLRTLKIPHHEATITVDELKNADEIWITSTTRLINPITQIDDNILTRENYGLIWQRVNDLLQKQLKTSKKESMINA